MTQIRERAAALAVLAIALAAGTTAVQGQTGDTVVIDGLMWALQTNGEDVPWNDANQHCEDLELAGQEDWRLPTLAEVETLYDPDSEAIYRIRSPFVLEGCCLWSSTDLTQVEPDVGGALLQPTAYRWGLLFASGIRYYSATAFPDGQALCVREDEAHQ